MKGVVAGLIAGGGWLGFSTLWNKADPISFWAGMGVAGLIAILAVMSD